MFLLLLLFPCPALQLDTINQFFYHVENRCVQLELSLNSTEARDLILMTTQQLLYPVRSGI